MAQMLTVEKDFFTAAESGHVRALDHMIRGLMETRKTVQAQLVGHNWVDVWEKQGCTALTCW